MPRLRRAGGHLLLTMVMLAVAIELFRAAFNLGYLWCYLLVVILAVWAVKQFYLAFKGAIRG